MQKLAIFSGLAMAPFVLAFAIWGLWGVITAMEAVKFMSAFQKIHESKPALTIVEVEQLMGPPASIEESESPDQTIKGEVYHYSISHPKPAQDFKVIFVNGTVFSTQFVPLTKS